MATWLQKKDNDGVSIYQSLRLCSQLGQWIKLWNECTKRYLEISWCMHNVDINDFCFD